MVQSLEGVYSADAFLHCVILKFAAPYHTIRPPVLALRNPFAKLCLGGKLLAACPVLHQPRQIFSAFGQGGLGYHSPLAADQWGCARPIRLRQRRSRGRSLWVSMPRLGPKTLRHPELQALRATAAESGPLASLVRLQGYHADRLCEEPRSKQLETLRSKLFASGNAAVCFQGSPRGYPVSLRCILVSTYIPSACAAPLSLCCCSPKSSSLR